MSFEEFIDRHRGLLFGYYCIEQRHPGSMKVVAPYPPSSLSAEDEKALKTQLIACMPKDSMILDLWDWDCRFESDLSDDWFYGSAFGSTADEEGVADELVEYFLLKAAEYGMDYDLAYDSLDLRAKIEDAALSFIQQWRGNLQKHLLTALETGVVK